MARHSAARLASEWLATASVDSSPLPTWLPPIEALLTQLPAVISRDCVNPPSRQRLCRVDQPQRPTQSAPHLTAPHASGSLAGTPGVGAAMGAVVGCAVGVGDGARVGADVGLGLGKGVG